MPIHQLNTIDDPRIAVYRDLPHSDRPRVTGRLIVEGRLLVERLLDSEFETESILIDRQLIDQLPASALEYPVFAMEVAAIRDVVGYRFHRGVLACGRRGQERQFGDVLPAQQAEALIVICVDVRDPMNLGGIVRCAAAFGADCVVVNGPCADPFSRRALRVSMGSVLTLPIVGSSDVVRDVRTLQGEFSFELCAAVLDGEADLLDKAPRPPRLGLVIGGEDCGLSDEIANQCDRRVTIPMQLNTDSLNAAVASGIFLYHFTRPSRDANESA